MRPGDGQERSRKRVLGSIRVGAGAVLASLFPSAVLAAEPPGGADKTRCAASYEAAQLLRREERLSAARAELLVCEETCPETLAEDCARWRDELTQLMPTARLFVRDTEGKPLHGVHVAIDGHPVAGVVDESPLAVEPGRHVFRFDRVGHLPAEVRAEFHVGERDHAVYAVLTSTASPPPPHLAEPRTPPQAKTASRTPSYVLGGIGIAALAAAGGLTIKGYTDRDSLRDSCAPYCDQSDVDSVRTLWWTAGGLAVAGAAAIGVAIVLWPRTTVSVAPRSVALSIALP